MNSAVAASGTVQQTSITVGHRFFLLHYRTCALAYIHGTRKASSLTTDNL